MPASLADDSGFSARLKRDLRHIGAHQTGHLLVDDLDDHLGGIEAVHDIGTDGPLLHSGDELLDYLEVYIRLQQRHFDFAHC